MRSRAFLGSSFFLFFVALSGVFHESEIVAVFGLAGLFRVCELMSVLVGGLFFFLAEGRFGQRARSVCT